jgi:hypothetical protein
MSLPDYARHQPRNVLPQNISLAVAEDAMDLPCRVQDLAQLAMVAADRQRTRISSITSNVHRISHL